MKLRKAIIAMPAALVIGACATVPPAGPGVMALPGTASSFDQFRRDDLMCRQYAADSVGNMTPAQAATDSAVRSTVTGAAVGAAAGAVIGAATGDPGTGAAVGAGTGAIVGAASGAGAYSVAADNIQERYDIAYVQCMYANGHQVPLPANYTAAPRPVSSAPPPPPPGPPPPPPPGR
jgi:hypothetical protein